MGPDHREPIPEGHDDRSVDPGEGLRQYKVLRHGHPAGAIRIVEPMHAEQVGGIGIIGPDVGEPLCRRLRHQLRVRKLRERRQHDPRLFEPLNRAVV